MHVLIIHQALASPQDAGGTRHFEVAEHLVRAGHRVTILASQVNYLTGEAAPGRARLVVKDGSQEGIELWRCYAYTAMHRSFVHRLLAYWSFTLSSFAVGLQTERVDVVWGTSPPIFQAATALVLARLKRVPFLFEVRDLWPDFAVDLGVLRNSTLIALSRQLERALYLAADQIVVNSPGFVPHLRSCGVPESKIAVVANGVETAQFDPSDQGAELRREQGLDGRFVVLYAGAHGMANDLDTLLEAARHLRDEPRIAFALVGDGKEKANLIRHARDMGLDNVFFIPAQPKRRMPGVIAAADVCVAILKDIEMFRTTYPNKVFDYMAAGRPTILAIDGVIRDVIEDADGGTFVPPGDAAALAATISRYARDPDLCRRQGGNARRYVQTHFDRGKQARSIGLILTRMVRAAGRVVAVEMHA